MKKITWPTEYEAEWIGDNNMYSIIDLLEERKGIDPLIRTSRQRKKDLDKALEKIEEQESRLKDLRRIEASREHYYQDAEYSKIEIKKLEAERDELKEELRSPAKKMEKRRNIFEILIPLSVIAFFLSLAIAIHLGGGK